LQHLTAARDALKASIALSISDASARREKLQRFEDSISELDKVVR
jgi:hypothetical protein